MAGRSHQSARKPWRDQAGRQHHGIDLPGGHPAQHELGPPVLDDDVYDFVLDHLDAQGYQGAVGLEYHPSTGRAEDCFGWLEEYDAARGRRP